MSALFFISANTLAAEIKIEKAEKKPIIFTPQITIPGSEIFKKGVPFTITKETMPTMARDLYRFLVGSSGIVAVIVMMAGGYLWLFAGGNTARVGQAKDYIGGAVVGLTLSLGSYMILNMINPDLINMKDFEIPAVPKVTMIGIPVAGGLSFPGLKCVWAPNYPNDGGYIGVSEKNEKYFCGVRPADFEISIPNKTESIQQPPVCFCKITSQCTPIESGLCAPSALNSYFDEKIIAEAASRVCKVESGGNQFNPSGTDICYDGKVFSFGLFQINLWATDNLDGLNCTSAFEKTTITETIANTISGWGYDFISFFTGEKKVSRYNCKVKNENLYSQCVQKAIDADINLKASVKLYNYTHGWNQGWQTTNTKCGFNP